MLNPDRLRDLFMPLLNLERVRLCDIRTSGGYKRPIIQLFVDMEDVNITIDECVSLSRQVQDILDMQDWTPEDYRLEVSSPGIDFPLTELWQFRKNVGRLILNNDQDASIEGRILSVDDEGLVRLETKDGEVEYSLDQVGGAKVVVELGTKKTYRSKRKRR